MGAAKRDGLLGGTDNNIREELCGSSDGKGVEVSERRESGGDTVAIGIPIGTGEDKGGTRQKGGGVRVRGGSRE